MLAAPAMVVLGAASMGWSPALGVGAALIAATIAVAALARST
jgi:hypothetical protein